MSTATAEAPVATPPAPQVMQNPLFQNLRQDVVNTANSKIVEIGESVDATRTEASVKQAVNGVKDMAKGHVESAHNCCKAATVIRKPTASGVRTKAEGGLRLLTYSVIQAIKG
jgi:hypothetical protein